MSGQARALSGSTCDGDLTVAGVSMRTEAWWVADLTPLWAVGPHRGADRVIPGVHGQRAYPRRRDPLVVDLRLLIVGSHTSSGAVNADPWSGVFANDRALRAVTDPVATGTGTRACVLTDPDGGTWNFDAHVSLTLGEPFGTPEQVVQRAVLAVNVPTGIVVS